jgi:hypothetical protein
MQPMTWCWTALMLCTCCHSSWAGEGVRFETKIEIETISGICVLS